jgi:hypothetical protein
MADEQFEREVDEWTRRLDELQARRHTRKEFDAFATRLVKFIAGSMPAVDRRMMHAAIEKAVGQAVKHKGGRRRVVPPLGELIAPKRPRGGQEISPAVKRTLVEDVDAEKAILLARGSRATDRTALRVVLARRARR